MSPRIKSEEEANEALRNAAIAIAIIPLFNNIDDSVNKEWNKETFDETDRAMNQFVEDLEKLGYGITRLVSPQEVYDRTGESLARINTVIDSGAQVH